MKTVLVVDDKEMLRDSVGVTLQRAGFTVLAAGGGEQALDIIHRRRPDAIVTDLKMPGMTGVELLEHVREFDDDMPVVLMTAYGTIETAVQAMKLGAFTYITKPFEGDELIVSVKRAIDHGRTKRENEILRRSAQTTTSSPSSVDPKALERIVGSSSAIEEVKEQVRAIAGSQGTSLIHGESGVGKEVVARSIHESSPRAGEPFLALNCAALSPTLLESELFGHEKGAFTGAEKLRKGRFELAHGGTLLLDEISEVSPHIQAKLLRVLQERVFERVGSSTPIGVDVRVLATTNRDLPSEVAKGNFRQDLYFRLNVLPVHIPPLRERPDDIATLAEHFVAICCQREGRPVPSLTPEAIQLMSSYHWPGNVRELQNICERVVVLGRTERIEASLIQPWLAGQPGSTIALPDAMVARSAPSSVVESAPLPQAPSSSLPGDLLRVQDEDGQPRLLEDIERDAIITTLRRFQGHRQKTAASLGIGVRTLGLKLKKWKEEELIAQDL
ncbi:MAG: sigma-54-dependent transcriptional regulator [Phycisphaerales bacterium JB043]